MQYGKGRLDKWYRLAKEKGYRARAAFKLIQINRKFGFLEKSKVLLDLCAAPGSWCQVAADIMPANSMIVGVDLAPMKPIPRTVTFQSDITTDQCRATIRRHFKNWKADTVLHDGAPNVGTAWVQDAFSQAELALQALKLATEFLVEGGTFVTKVFRSKDYNALLWVFNRLFTKVEATKPPSSRNVSAEIFVVCSGFKAPKRIDPKFLDPRSVFAELSNPTPDNEAKVFNPEKKKRKREGYEEGDYTQFKEAPASDFIQTTDPIAMLGSLNRLTFEQQKMGDVALAALDKLPETTDEVRQCCMDLKLLGRKEFRTLLRWRLRARDIFGFASKRKYDEDAATEEVAEVMPMDEALKIQAELHKLNENEASRKKRRKRRENERKQREVIRMQMHMSTPSEIGLEKRGPNGEESMFVLAPVDKAGAVDKVACGKMIVHLQDKKSSNNVSGSASESDEEEDGLDEELDALYHQYQERKLESDAKYRAKKARKEQRDNDWEGFSSHGRSSDEGFEMDQNSDESSSVEGEEGQKFRRLIHRQDSFAHENAGLTRRAAVFFDQDVFKGIGNLGAEDETDGAVHFDDEETENSIVSQAVKGPATTMASVRFIQPQSVMANPSGATKEQSSDENEESDDETGKRRESNKDGNGSNFEVVKADQTHWEAESERRNDARLDIDIITAEAMTLAQQIALGQQPTQGLVDDGFNKYAFRDTDGLPDWFLDDEGKHSKPHRPISAAGAAAIKEKLRAFNARPIKKVREAKDRKKFKAAQRLEKLRKKSALVVDDEGISEKDKAHNIAKMMSKSTKKKPKPRVKLVVAKGGNKGISGRPRGVKGKYKIVDARLKKDVRAEKRLAKKKH